MSRRISVATALFCVLLAVVASPLAAADWLPTLIVESPPELTPVAAELRALDRALLAPAMRLSGLTFPGPPIKVVLAPERSELARRAPPWAAGYADGRAGVVVILPARAISYPYSSLPSLLQHEVAHVLIDRAAEFGTLPRWFHEGVATAAARSFGLEDRGRLAFEILAAGSAKRHGLDAAFSGSAAQARAAYALSHAMIRRLERQAGPDAVPDILARVAAGEEFADAFGAATGIALAAFEAAFWREQSWWNRWLPLLTSSAALWLAITLLALVAFKRRRDRDAAMMRRWEEEERAEQERFAAAVRARLTPEELALLAGDNEAEEDGVPVN